METINYRRFKVYNIVENDKNKEDFNNDKKFGL